MPRSLWFIYGTIAANLWIFLPYRGRSSQKRKSETDKRGDAKKTLVLSLHLKIILHADTLIMENTQRNAYDAACGQWFQNIGGKRIKHW